MKSSAEKQSRYQNPFIAIFTGIRDILRTPENQLKLNDTDRLDGKKVLVTGASSGLGLATALELARRGAFVIMMMRSGIPDRVVEVRRKSGSDRVESVHFDLKNPGALDRVANEIKERFGTLDILICNAAMVAGKSRPIAGLDEMFLVNYFSKFLMINYLLDLDCFSKVNSEKPRIIFVASESHRNPEEIEWDRFGIYEPYGTGKSVAMYGYYKLLLVTMVQELSRRLNSNGTNYSVFSLCPGPVNSSIAREAPAIVQPLLKLVFRLFFRSPERACRPVIYLASSPDMEGRSGEYLFLMEKKDVDPKAADPGNGKRLWDMSMQLKKKLEL